MRRAKAAKPVLVTGATGFVGGAVVRALLAHGHDVTALVRSPERAGALADHGARLRTGDMLQPESYRDAVDHVDAVIHAAQSTPSGRMTAKKVRQIQHADHIMTATLAPACAAAGKRLVYTSGYFNYGDRGDNWITTQTPFEPSPLGAGHAAEVQALRREAASGLDLVVVAPGFVYGPGGFSRAHSGIRPDVADCGASAAGVLAIEKEVPLAAPILLPPIDIQVGPLPVVIVPSIEFKAGFQGDIIAGLGYDMEGGDEGFGTSFLMHTDGSVTQAPVSGALKGCASLGAPSGNPVTPTAAGVKVQAYLAAELSLKAVRHRRTVHRPGCLHRGLAHRADQPGYVLCLATVRERSFRRRRMGF